MTFDSSNLNIGGDPSGGAGTIYTYRSALDLVSEILGSGYFDSKKTLFRIGDFVLLSGSDRTAIAAITAVDPVTLGERDLAFGGGVGDALAAGFTEGSIGWDVSANAPAVVGGTPSTSEYVSTFTKLTKEALHIVSLAGTQVTVRRNIPPLSIPTPFNSAGMWVYVVDWEAIDSVTLTVGPVGFAVDQTVTYTLNSGIHNQFNGWHFVAMHEADASKDVWGDLVDDILIRVNPSAGNVAEVYIDSVVLSFSHKPKILLTFDDGYDNHYTKAVLYLDQNDMRGTFYVIAAEIDSAGNMTTAQLQEIYATGHDIAVHGLNNIDAMTLANAQIEIQANQVLLLDNSMPRAAYHYSYPGGGYSITAISALKGMGFKSARATPAPIYWRQGSHFGKIPDNIYEIGIARTASAADSVADITAVIDGAISRESDAFILFHQILESGATGISINRPIFEGVIDYLKTKVDDGSVEVETISGWYSRQ